MPAPRSSAKPGAPAPRTSRATCGWRWPRACAGRSNSSRREPRGLATISALVERSARLDPHHALWHHVKEIPLDPPAAALRARAVAALQAAISGHALRARPLLAALADLSGPDFCLERTVAH